MICPSYDCLAINNGKFFFLSRQLRRLRLRRRRRCTFRENLHCVKAAWILSISELYLAAVQCTHCTQEFHTLLIYVILYWDRYLKNWKHIKIKEKRVFLHQNQSEWQRMDFICLIAVLYLLFHREGGQIQSINEIPVQNYFFQMMTYLKEEKWHRFFICFMECDIFDSKWKCHTVLSSWVLSWEKSSSYHIGSSRY